jgi:hypothetical protein
MISKLNVLYNQYKKYIGYQIYFLIETFFQIDNLYQKYITETYGFIDKHNDLEKKLNFLMIKDSNLNSLIENKNIFIKTYEETVLTKKYFCVLTLRENVSYIYYLNRVFNNFYKSNNTEQNPTDYTIYKKNVNTNNMIVCCPLNDSESLIKKIIEENFTLMVNILEYDEKYSQLNYLNWKELYDNWICPLEPLEPSGPSGPSGPFEQTNSDNYNKLIGMSISKETVCVDGIYYTDTLCYRNFIQKDFKLNVNILFGTTFPEFENDLYFAGYEYPDNKFIKDIPMLFTTYREGPDKKITMILH